MKNNKNTDDNRLSFKDLVTIGIFAIIYFILTFIVGTPLGITVIGFTVYPFALALISGIVTMFFMAKVPRKWAVMIFFLLPGLISTVMGHTYILLIHTLLIALLAELVHRLCGLKSIRGNILTHTIGSIWAVGSFWQIFIMTDRYYEMTKSLVSQSYADKIIELPWWISDIDIKDLLSLISYVSQDNFLFNLTIRENLLIGSPNASEAEMIEALKKAEAYDFIDRLPDKLDSLAGQGGTKFSGGEVQRLAIARAILKNAPILILDEATSFADPENEELIQKGLGSLMQNKTVLIIAHRLHTITNADQIVVLDRGKCKAIGKHEELLKNNILYRNLFSHSQMSQNWEIEVKN